MTMTSDMGADFNARMDVRSIPEKVVDFLMRRPFQKHVAPEKEGDCRRIDIL